MNIGFILSVAICMLATITMAQGRNTTPRMTQAELMEKRREFMAELRAENLKRLNKAFDDIEKADDPSDAQYERLKKLIEIEDGFREMEYKRQEAELERASLQARAAAQLATFDRLYGAKLFASDGTFLGVITSNSYDSDSIFNDYGKYGSDYSSESIWNDYSDYGDEYNSKSAFNDCASEPPRIVKNNKVIGYLTVNTAKLNGVHPKELLIFLDDDEGEDYRKRIMEFMD